MSKVTGPLLSFSASGSVAKTQTYSKWRGIPYVRRYVIPGNPNTAGQQLTRNVFRWASGAWVWLPAIGQEPWSAYATGRAFTDRNAWMSRAISQMRNETDIDMLEGSPGVRGGLPPISVTVTPSTTSASIAVVAPSIPPGWSLTASQCIVLPEQNPQDDFVNPVQAFQATSPATPIAVTGLVTATDYVACTWLKWDRGGNGFAYSISSNTPFTTT